MYEIDLMMCRKALGNITNRVDTITPKTVNNIMEGKVEEKMFRSAECIFFKFHTRFVDVHIFLPPNSFLERIEAGF